MILDSYNWKIKIKIWHEDWDLRGRPKKIKLTSIENDRSSQPEHNNPNSQTIDIEKSFWNNND